ncbi:hypothetical protein KQX54_005550 [Cotesia glomerata]|uniref:Uncharacterized protein n=1 Tax=Cotesia glomerata TaxID=32391 RepID=A0AAV7IME7_COTGL|nr:hypothetical protein KQX54_005550 [Cotesia glomerata]
MKTIFLVFFTVLIGFVIIESKIDPPRFRYMLTNNCRLRNAPCQINPNTSEHNCCSAYGYKCMKAPGTSLHLTCQRETMSMPNIG